MGKWEWSDFAENIATAEEWIDTDQGVATGILDQDGNELYRFPDAVEFFGFVPLTEEPGGKPELDDWPFVEKL